MHFSKQFLNLVQHELSLLDSLAVLKNVVIYCAQTENGKPPTLKVIGEIPGNSSNALPPIENDPDLRVPSPDRRWYPLQDGSVLLGVIRAERFSTNEEWPDHLDQKLQSSALVLSNSLSLELERKSVFEELIQQKEQIQILVHQLRNPLTALKTYAQLLLRKLDKEPNQIDLVKGLLNEQAQVNKYLLALDQLSQQKEKLSAITPMRLLLPPLLPQKEHFYLKEILKPLVDRAEATARLQERKWFGPDNWPNWMEEKRTNVDGFIGEIVANLLENAFKHSPKGSSIGLSFNEYGLCVWDSGTPINKDVKEKIFLSGFRTSASEKIQGSGLGLNLARNLAEQLGGTLDLYSNPNQFNPSLPSHGNAFVLRLPLKTMQQKIE